MTEVVRRYHGPACVTVGFSHRLAEGSMCYQELTWITYGWQMLSEGRMAQHALLWGFSIGLQRDCLWLTEVVREYHGPPCVSVGF